MAKDDDNGHIASVALLYAFTYKKRTDSLSLARGYDGHGGQCSSTDNAGVGVNRKFAEQYVTDYTVALDGDQRSYDHTICTQPVNQTYLGILPEGQSVYFTDGLALLTSSLRR